MASVFDKIFAKNHSLSWHHVSVFVLTYFSYVFFRANRRAFDDCKNTLNKSFVFQSSEPNEDPILFFGKLDTTFAFAYAIGLFISGIMGDRLNLRYMLTIGMCGSAVTTLITGYLNNITKTQYKYYYYVLYSVNGLFQSIGWPVTVAIMGNWFSSGDILYGIWGGNGPLGYIICSYIISYSLSYDYKIGLLLNSSLLFCGGVIILFCLITHPNQVGLKERNLSNVRNLENDFRTKKAVGFGEAILLPGVLAYALSLSFVLMINDIFNFSLQTYLSLDPKWDDRKSNSLISFYDYGSIIGGIIAGILSKLIGMRSPVISIMLLFSAATICLNYKLVEGRTNHVIIFFNGFLVGGLDNIISTAISVDLSKHDQITNNAHALATITGIIDGTGHFVTAIAQCLIPLIKKKYNWDGVFYFLMIVTGFSCFWSFFILYKDILNKKKKNYLKL
ncbi:sugar phosphate exchanger 3-like isoform X1 [Hydra vulgaris]|uniref:sugar phosphate exchanger 3-like isoform X1 n=1 Tax=Hydra vulgaris TaxID=6087 RepID=UPI0032EA4B84